MNEQIKLKAERYYNENYPPKNAAKPYVAKIVGREAGPKKFAREFFGRVATLLPGDEGLYEVQDAEKRGGHTRYYFVIVSHPEHGLIRSRDCEEIAPNIAKLLGEGVAISDAIEITNIEADDEGHIFTAVARSKSQATRAARSVTIETAAAQCLDVLRLLSAKEQKAALKLVRDGLAPPAAGEAPATEAQP